MPDALYLVDGSGFIFRAYHALPKLLTRAGVPTGAVYGFAQMLLKLETDHRPSHLAVVFDAGDSRRTELYPAYKEHRPEPPDDLAPQFGLVKRVVDGFGVPRLELQGYEADDVIATLARRAQAGGLRVVIVSSDKDLMQLVDGEHVVMHDTMKELTYGPAEVQAKFGVGPAQLGDVLALMGDSVDNVPGVPGVGPKTAAALIGEFGSLEALLAGLDLIGKEGGKGAKLRGADRVKELLRKHAEDARISRRLVALDEKVPLPEAVVGADGIEGLRRREPDMAAVEALLRELEFDRLIGRLRPAMGGAGAASTGQAPTSGAPATGGEPSVSALPALPEVANQNPVTAAMRARLTLPDAPHRTVLTASDLQQLVADLAEAPASALTVERGEGATHLAPIVGLAIAADGMAPAYLPLGHRYLGAPAQLATGEVLRALGDWLRRDDAPKFVHGAKEIEVALASHVTDGDRAAAGGACLRGVAVDVELASYLIDAAAGHDLVALAERYGVTLETRDAICGAGLRRGQRAHFETVDVERAAAWTTRCAQATLALGRALAAELDEKQQAKLLRDVELPLGRVLARMERHGVRLDTGHLQGLGREVERELARLEEEVHQLAGTDVNLGSPKQLSELLFDKLQLPPVKKTKTGYSTDAETLEELAALHPIAAKIHEHRGLAKLKSTYIDALPQLVDPRTGRLHTSYRQAVAATGRLSSTEPNLQNIPIRTELGRKIRRAFVAEPGWKMIAADYSQIELRVVAHLSKDPVLVDAFTRGQDIHERTACEVFTVEPAQVTPEMRRVAKAINYGIVYGQTDYGLSRVLGIEKAEAKKYLDGYLRRYAGVAKFMERLIQEAHRDAGARTVLGRFRPLPDLSSRNRVVRQAAERMARNTPIQGTAADLLKVAMIDVDRALDEGARPARMLLTVHDELVLEAPADSAPRVSELVKEKMERAFELDVPLKVDVGAGDNWDEC